MGKNATLLKSVVSYMNFAKTELLESVYLAAKDRKPLCAQAAGHTGPFPVYYILKVKVRFL